MANGAATWNPSSFFAAGALGAAALDAGTLGAANASAAKATPSAAARIARHRKNLRDASTLFGLLPVPSRFNTEPARRLPRAFGKNRGRSARGPRNAREPGIQNYGQVPCFEAGVHGFRARAKRHAPERQAGDFNTARARWRPPRCRHSAPARKPRSAHWQAARPERAAPTPASRGIDCGAPPPSAAEIVATPRSCPRRDRTGARRASEPAREAG